MSPTYSFSAEFHSIKHDKDLMTRAVSALQKEINLLEASEHLTSKDPKMLKVYIKKKNLNPVGVFFFVCFYFLNIWTITKSLF